MTLKKSLLLSPLVFLLVQTTVWAQVANPKVTAPKTAPVSFDAAIPAFETTAEGKAYIKKYGRKPEIADAFGYPMPKLPIKKESSLYQKKISPNAPKPKIGLPIKVLPVKNNPNVKKSTFIQKIFGLFISSAYAYDLEEDADGNLSIMNCRDVVNDSTNPGYFRAYFEDLAYNNGQGSGVGYDELEDNLGAARRNAVCDVLSEIATLIKLDQPYGATPTILFTKDWPAGSALNALASGTTYFSGPGSGFLHEHIISRIDPSGGPDAAINTNWGVSWSYDDSTLTASTFDFATVMRHEILHILGFASFLQSVITHTNTPNNHSHWDRNLFSQIIVNSPLLLDCDDSSNCTPFYSLGFSPLLQVPVGSPSQWFNNNRGTYQGRKNFVDAPLDGPRPLYTPTSWVQGSSLGHFDMARSSQTYVMNPSIATNEARDIHQHEKEVLCHIGYQVVGLEGSGCDFATPVANDDTGQLSSTTTTDIALMNNDEDFSGNGIPSNGNLRLHDLQVLSPDTWPPLPIVYYTQATIAGACSGSTTTLSSARCIRVTNPISFSPVKIKYQVRNVTTNRISDPATVNYSRCNVPSDEYVCNGSFEMGLINSISNHVSVPPGVNSLGYNDVPFWRDLSQSSDMVVQQVEYQNTFFWRLPNQYQQNLPDHSTYALSSIYYKDSSEFPPYYSEIPRTKLKAPLVVGQCYKISMESVVFNSYNYVPSGTLINIRANLSISDHNEIEPQSYAPITPPGVVALNVFSQINGPNFVESYFVPAQPFEDLFLYIFISSIDSDRLLRHVVDNVSVKKVNQALCANNTISGVVYNDQNLNGNLNIGEAGIQGVPVSLFRGDSGEQIGEPVTTDASGRYQFFSVPPFVNYFVAINPESSVALMTEPAINTSSLLIGFQRFRNVPYTNGGVVTGENFGVLLSGQNPILPPPTITSAPMCSTGGNLTANAPSGLSGPITYAWTGPSGSNVGNTQTISASAVGTYTVIVSGSDYSGSATLTVQLAAATQPNATVNNPTTGNNGSISLSPVGQGPFTYLWANNGGTSASRTNLAPGSYSVTITNANGCTSTHSFTLFGPPIITPAPMCSTGGNLTANAPSGLTGPFTYSWAGPTGVNVGSTQSITASAVGTYTATVSNSSGYSRSATHTLQLPAATQPGQVLTHATLGSNGSITLNPVGQGPFTYLWANNGGTTASRANLAPGSYSVTITNTNGCTSTHSFTLFGAPAITSAPMCSTGGNLTATPPSGLTGPFTYSWTGPSGVNVGNTQTIAASTVGTYTVTVGATGYSGSATQTLQLPAATQPNATVNSPTAGNNGSITLAPIGQGPFTYFWASNGGTSASRTNLAPGTYPVTITNANGCSSTHSFTLNAPPTVTQGSINCSSMMQVTANPPAGTSGTLSYQWKNSSNMVVGTTQATLLASGTYTVKVTSTGGYVGTALFTITIPAYTPPTLTTVITNATAPSFNNGKIVGTVAGGLAPFTFTFSDAVTSGAISSTTYTRTGISGSNDWSRNLLVQDSRGCSSTVLNLKVLSRLTATASAARSCLSGTPATTLTAQPAGGHGNYSYEWRVNGQSQIVSTASSWIGGVPGVTYNVTIKDSSSPQQILPPLTVTVPASTPAAHTVNVAVIDATNGLSNGSATVTTTAGLGPYTYSYSPGTLTFQNISGNSHSRTGLPAGTYTVTVKTFLGCSVSKSFVIKASAAAVVPTKN